MKKLVTTALFAVAVFVTNANASVAKDPVNLVVMVEPEVMAQYGAEAVQDKLEKDLAFANEAFKPIGVTFQIGAVLTDTTDYIQNGRNKGLTAWEMLGWSAESMKFDFDVFYSKLHRNDRSRVDVLYHKEIKGIAKQYGADNIVFVVKHINMSHEPSNQVIGGVALGNVLFGITMTTRTSSFAHELGHLWTLDHPSDEQCKAFNSIMCYGFNPPQAFHQSEIDTLAKVANGIYPNWGNVDTAFYAGNYSAPIPKLASANVSVKHNPIAHDLPSTDVMVSLLDDKGAPVVFEKETSVEIFSRSDSAISGIHFSKEFYQRVTFAPGETQKNIPLAVMSDSTERRFTIGARYGIGIKDSQPVNVTINPKPKSTGGDSNTGSGGGSGGGSVSFGWMLLLALALKLRR